jgi:hypothetical protein
VPHWGLPRGFGCIQAKFWLQCGKVTTRLLLYSRASHNICNDMTIASHKSTTGARIYVGITAAADQGVSPQRAATHLKGLVQTPTSGLGTGPVDLALFSNWRLTFQLQSQNLHQRHLIGWLCVERIYEDNGPSWWIPFIGGYLIASETHLQRSKFSGAGSATAPKFERAAAANGKVIMVFVSLEWW